MTIELTINKRAGNNHYVARKEEADPVNDNYESPAWPVQSLIEREPYIRGKIVDLCCGPGSIARELRRLLPDSTIVGSDIRHCPTMPEGCVGGIDAMDPTNCPPKSCDWVVSNFPFTISMELTLNALRMARVGVAVIQRNQWLESSGRYYGLWGLHTPARVRAFTDRVNFFPEGQINLDANGGMLMFSWFIFMHSWKFDWYQGSWITDKAHFEYDTRIGFQEALIAYNKRKVFREKIRGMVKRYLKSVRLGRKLAKLSKLVRGDDCYKPKKED